MARIRGNNFAFGWPGIPPRWTAGSKDGVGTAASDASKVWFTIWKGILTEIYWPRVDTPQTRDLQFLITDGSSFFHEEKRDLTNIIEREPRESLGYHIVNSDPEGRYTITKDIIADPLLSCVLQRTKVECKTPLQESLRLFVLFSPHMDRGGGENEAFVMEQSGRELLVAHKGDSWCALGASIPFKKLSAGFVGVSDGWRDISENFEMTWEYDQALNGNVALTAELDLKASSEFTLGLAFGDTMQSAIATLFQALGFSFEERKKIFDEEWKRESNMFLPLAMAASDGGNLYLSSTALLIAHEDKTYPGAFAASLSIPWGEAKGDEDLGGYHLVWTRDLVNTAMGMLAAGDTSTPLRVLIYLAATQHTDGGFSQNFWVDGTAYWGGMQLDEVALPILLARRLFDEGGLQEFDPFEMVLRAAKYLIVNGPATQQERWEEASGYSPSTLAATIAALIAASCFADEHGDAESAEYLRDYADFLECHLEQWTVTNAGTLVPGILRHFIRILPLDPSDPSAPEDPDTAIISLKNQPPNERTDYPAKENIDAGFLELVRYGIRPADDPVILDSVKVVDAILRTETPFGPSFHRYNHDGYGQRDDGTSFVDWGRGRLWPLLTGERGHYEMAAGRDAKNYLHAIEHFATNTGLLTEQVWDTTESPVDWLKLGLPTGAAMPLMWAHAEYVRLLRSIRGGKVFDRVDEVAERYLGDRKNCKRLEFWKPNRHISMVKRGDTFRIQASEPFTLHWTPDEWETEREFDAVATNLGVYYFDLETAQMSEPSIQFTMRWTRREEWEAKNYDITITN